MANTKISELTAVTALAGTDVFPVVDVSASTTNKVSVTDLLRNAPAGTASAPGIANADDQDTGILFPAANSIGVATGGAQRLVIDSSGNVGIGTSSPSQLFEVRGSTAIMARFRDSSNGIIDLKTTGSTNSDPVQIDAVNRPLSFAFNGSEKLKLDTDGRFGIGTTSPFRSVHVSGSSDQYVRITSTNSANAGIEFGDSDDAGRANVIYSNSADSMLFTVNGSERLRIDSSGNLGIVTGKRERS